MSIKINEIESIKTPESFSVTFDDRIEKIQLINGNTVQDYGHVASGDYFTISAVFSKVNFNKIVRLWEQRRKVNFTDESGEMWENVRLVLKSFKYQVRFPNYVLVDFEIWRI